MNSENLITVNIYGAGSRDSRMRAEYVYCAHAHECSAYKRGTCFCVTVPFGRPCQFGSVTRIDGGTKRAKKYEVVYKEAKANEKYAALKYPYTTYITRVGGNAYFTLPNVDLKETENGAFVIDDVLLFSKDFYTKKERLTPENINLICSFYPRGFSGQVIETYQKKVIPFFLLEFSKAFSDEYKNFIEKYPSYKDVVPDYTGREAYLATCNRKETYKDTKGNVFRFDGDCLVCEDYKSAFIPFDAPVAEIKIPVTKKMTVKIQNNNQVTENTEFV